jgi:hypothetical protein
MVKDVPPERLLVLQTKNGGLSNPFSDDGRNRFENMLLVQRKDFWQLLDRASEQSRDLETQPYFIYVGESPTLLLRILLEGSKKYLPLRVCTRKS